MDELDELKEILENLRNNDEKADTKFREKFDDKMNKIELLLEADPDNMEVYKLKLKYHTIWNDYILILDEKYTKEQ